MKIKILTDIVLTAMILLSSLFLYPGENCFALSTDELLKLKKAGVSEDIIVFMVEHDYSDVDKVSKLKVSGFKDETILAILKSELKGKLSDGSLQKGNAKDRLPNNSQENGNVRKESSKTEESSKPEESSRSEESSKREESSKTVNFVTSARVKILWYLRYTGDPVLLNSDTMDDVKVSIIDNNIMKFQWKQASGAFDFMLIKPFKSPIYWDINKDDILETGTEGYSFMLKSSPNHKGEPGSDASRYWLVYFEPRDSRIADYIKNAISTGQADDKR